MPFYLSEIDSRWMDCVASHRKLACGLVCVCVCVLEWYLFGAACSTRASHNERDRQVLRSMRCGFWNIYHHIRFTLPLHDENGMVVVKEMKLLCKRKALLALDGDTQRTEPLGNAVLLGSP